MEPDGTSHVSRNESGFPPAARPPTCGERGDIMQHSCGMHATSMQHPCNIHAMALAAIRNIPGFRARPPERFSQRRGVSGCEACGGHVARRRGQHGMTCGQRGAREPRRRLNRQHARARADRFFSASTGKSR